MFLTVLLWIVDDVAGYLGGSSNDEGLAKPLLSSSLSVCAYGETPRPPATTSIFASVPGSYRCCLQLNADVLFCHYHKHMHQINP